MTTRVSGEGSVKARLEHRMAGALANPYIAVATVLQASLLGVENKYPLPAPETGDGFELTDAEVGVGADLAVAIADPVADEVLGDAVGRMLVENQIFMRTAEVGKTSVQDDLGLRNFYIPFL